MNIILSFQKFENICQRKILIEILTVYASNLYGLYLDNLGLLAMDILEL
jgi:hypothetical protein